MTGGGGDSDPQCEWTAALARQGITVVAATGNNKANMMNEAPGACAKALAVSGGCWVSCLAGCTAINLPPRKNNQPINHVQTINHR